MRRRFEVSRMRTPSPPRFRPWESRSGPDLPPPAPSLSEKEFDFDAHWQKRHTRIIRDGNEERVVIEKDSPIGFRIDHQYDTLHAAAIANDEKGIERLLQGGHRDYLNEYNQDGQTPLQSAIDYSSHRAISYLVEQGAHANEYNRDGEYTAWILANAYAESIAYMNMVPLMALAQALAQRGELHKYQIKKQKKRVPEVKKINKFEAKPSKRIRLRRRAVLEEAAPETSAEAEYDEYLLNV